MIYIKDQLLGFMRKLTLKKIVVYTMLETVIIIAIGSFLALVIPEFRILTADFIYVVVIVELFEMLSIINCTTVNEDSFADETLHWLRFLIFTLVSFVYIFICLGLLPEKIYTNLFLNLKITSLLTMVLILGMDLTIDKIYEFAKSDPKEIEE